MVALAGLLHTAGASSSAACMARRRGTCAVAAAAAAAAARAGRRPSLQPNPKRSCCVFMGPKHFREILAAGILRTTRYPHRIRSLFPESAILYMYTS